MGRLTSASIDPLIVRTVNLNTLIEFGQVPPPNLIKCDIEGGEYHALTGANRILSTYRPKIFLATHGSQVHQQCCQLLMEFDYELSSLDKQPLGSTSEVLAVPRA